MAYLWLNATDEICALRECACSSARAPLIETLMRRWSR